MAILKHIPIKNRYYSSAVEYLTCQFDEYTNEPVLDEKGRIMEREEYMIEGINCEVDTFGAECIETNRFHGKNNAVKDVKAHHYIISFDPTDNITMEEALAFGKEWLSVFAPGHQAVIAAHPDGHHGSKNMHVHIVFNSVRKYAGVQEKWHYKPCEWKQGCKHRSTGRMMHNAKKWVMRRCLIQGYEQVDLLTKKHRDDYWVEKRLIKSNAKDGIGATSNKEIIRNTIDKFIPAVKSFEQLVECLTNIYGWNIRVTDKTVTFTMPDMKRGVRGNKLGDGYGKAELIERIDIAIKEKAALEAKRLAEENARAEAMRIAEEKAKAEAEAREKARLEEERKVAAEKAEQRRKEELSQKKRKLAFERNNIQFEYFMANADSDDWNSDYLNYLISEKITDYDSKTLEELSVPILTKEEFEQKQIEKMQEAISEKTRELWNDALNNIDGSVYSNKWKYLDYLEEIRYRKVDTLTLQQVKEPILSFWEFNEMMERESVEATMKVENTQDVAVEVATDAQKDFELDVTENDVVHKNPVVEPVVEDTVVVERVIEKTLTIEERAKEIATFIRKNYGKYDNVPVKVKAEQFQFSNDDLDADMELHSLVLKELNEKMYGADSFEDYMRIVDATEKKQSGELRRVEYYSNEKRWNRSR
ncbi:MAG: relaxase/mobilization nuclease domain-containing protein [Lachnospiraceae bacterium]|nr:relaxase/mobilization nuclease domain-containing protein [Lachnospiraceae bacterium]